MRIVVKMGTSVLTGGTRSLSTPQMVDFVRQCAELHHQGHEIIVCTSGAIAAGRARLDFPDLPATVASKQMLAAVGQSRLMLMWERLFEIYGIHSRPDPADAQRRGEPPPLSQCAGLPYRRCWRTILSP